MWGVRLAFGQALRGASVATILTLVVAFGAGRIEKTGDHLQIALPLMALGCAAVNGNALDTFGRFTALMATVHLQKRLLGDAQINQRPNGGTMGFPSGHTASAVFGASRLAHECLRSNPVAQVAVGLSAAYVGGSRISVGAHSYWQVLSGVIFALLFDRINRPMIARLRKRWARNSRKVLVMVNSIYRVCPPLRLERLEDLSRASLITLWAYSALVVSVLFTLGPALDLTITGLFYRQGGGFPAAEWPVVQFLRHALMNTMHLLALFSLIALGVTWRFGGRLLYLGARAWGYFTAVMILGPGIMVNMILKEHWGRARPVMVENFGAEAQFTPAFLPTAQCDSNCSFVSGEVSGATAIAIFLILLVLEQRSYFSAKIKARLFAVALTLPLISALQRVSAGAHFASDALLAIAITSGLALLIWPLIMQRDTLKWWDHFRPRTPSALQYIDRKLRSRS
ncbi:phosphatase PAP2 family protein [Rhodophyticola sp. SM2404]